MVLPTYSPLFAWVIAPISPNQQKLTRLCIILLISRHEIMHPRPNPCSFNHAFKNGTINYKQNTHYDQTLTQWKIWSENFVIDHEQLLMKVKWKWEWQHVCFCQSVTFIYSAQCCSKTQMMRVGILVTVPIIFCIYVEQSIIFYVILMWNRYIHIYHIIIKPGFHIPEATPTTPMSPPPLVQLKFIYE